MTPTYFCTRCGWKGLSASAGRAVCARCGNAFAVPVSERAARVTAYDIWTGVLLNLCMPVGLTMLWIHPTWPVRRKMLLTGLAVCLIVIPLVLCLLLVAVSPTLFHYVNLSPSGATHSPDPSSGDEPAGENETGGN